jgi:hypothetical protein
MLNNKHLFRYYMNKIIPNSNSKKICVPKTCVDSLKYIKYIKTNLNKNVYTISFNNDIFSLKDVNNKVLDNDDILSYSSNTKHSKISAIIASFINKYHFNFNVKYASLENDIGRKQVCNPASLGNPVLYVFLLPFVSIDNYYIIKVGYTKNIIKRYSELKKEFNVDDIYLMYSIQISGEHIELNIHKNLKMDFTTHVYKMKKKRKTKKSEINTISEETYKFSWILFKNILYIVYKTHILMDKFTLLDKENALLDKKNTLLITQNESKKLDNESKKLDNESKKSDNELESKKLDNESKKSDNEVKNNEIQLQILLAKIELLKLEEK